MFAKIMTALAILISTGSVVMANSVSGVILAYDRQAKLLVLNDKTVWALDGSEAAVPPELKAGDRIEIDFQSGDNGVTKIDAIRRAVD